MPTAKIAPIHNRFDNTTTQALDLVSSVRLLVRPGAPQAGHPGLPQFRLNLVFEFAFVRCFLAWEDFLFASMCAYLTGARGLSGASAKRRVNAKTLKTAEDLLIGERNFLSWGAKETVKTRAKLWFDDGEPYVTALDGFSDYKDLRIVRNRIVHNSQSAQKKFSELRARHHQAEALNGMGTGSFLSRTTGQPASSRLEAYVDEMRRVALEIATNK